MRIVFYSEQLARARNRQGGAEEEGEEEGEVVARRPQRVQGEGEEGDEAGVEARQRMMPWIQRMRINNNKMKLREEILQQLKKEGMKVEVKELLVSPEAERRVMLWLGRNSTFLVPMKTPHL